MRILVLLLLVVTPVACKHAQVVDYAPQCLVPPRPALPTITADETSVLEDDVYWKLETRERKLVDWALELESMLAALCKRDGE